MAAYVAPSAPKNILAGIKWPAYRYVLRIPTFSLSIDASPPTLAGMANFLGGMLGCTVTVWDTSLKQQVYSTEDSVWTGMGRAAE